MKKTPGMIVAGLSVAALLCACRKVESYEKPLTPVKTAAVEERMLSSEAARYSANIQPDSQVELAFKTGSYISSLLQVGGRAVEEGDWIRKGAVLAKVRDDEYTARIKQARALVAEAQAAQSQVRSQLAEAQSALENVKTEYDRAGRLFAADSLIKPDYDGLKSKYEAGQAKVESVKAQLAMMQAKSDAARAQVEELESLQRDTELKAPMDGILLKRNVEVGSLVSPGAVAFIIADLDPVKAVFGVPDVEAPGLKVGSVLSITTEAVRGAELQGRLARISPSADPKTRIFDVEVRIPNPGRKLKAGMVVALKAGAGNVATPVTVAPISSLFQLKEQGEGYAMFVVEETGGKQTARLRRVQIGRTLGNSVEALSGVSIGEQVIVSGATLVSDGDQVRIVR